MQAARTRGHVNDGRSRHDDTLATGSGGAQPPLPPPCPPRPRCRRAGKNARRFFVGGNWKANGSVAQVQGLVKALNSGLVASTTEVVVAPSAVHLAAVQGSLRKDFAVAGQDAFASTGAHTGETPAALLKDMGLKYAIVGHSERRQKWESNEVVAAKAKVAIESGLTVIACLGETLAEREAGKAFDVVTSQLAVRACRRRARGGERGPPRAAPATSAHRQARGRATRRRAHASRAWVRACVRRAAPPRPPAPAP